MMLSVRRTIPGGAALLVSLWALSGASRAQSLLYEVQGRLPGDELGHVVSELGDVTGDGVPDFLSGAPEALLPNIGRGGMVRVYSGANGGLHRTLLGRQDGSDFGFAVADAGDVDGDGTPDVVVGSPRWDDAGVRRGRVTIYSGADWTEIRELRGGAHQGLFGLVVDGLGDLNGDGRSEIVVGAPQEIGTAGRAVVFSGLDGSVLFERLGSVPGESLGFAVAGVGDVDADGTPDFAAGIPGASVNGASSGTVRVWSGASGALLLEVHGDAAGAQLGYSVAGAGRVDGDAHDDLVAGADEDGTNGTKAGLARVYAGATGAVLHTFLGDDAEDRLGRSVDGVGDVDGDGSDDVVVGAVRDDDGGLDAGAATVFSGADGSVLARVDGAPGGELGQSVAGVGDVNGDGTPDVIAGAPIAGNGLGRLVSPVTMPLAAVNHELSIGTGGLGQMVLDAGPAHAGSAYWILGSATGTSPGLDDVGGLHLPLNFDVYMQLSFNPGNALFVDFLGTLDANGRAAAALDLPPGLDRSIAGSTIHHAYMVVSTPGIADTISNPLPLLIVP